MEKKFIENALDVMKFDIEDSEKDLVQFVPMREYGVATNEEPLLLTINLQSCIALIAYEKNFSFLSHMNVITCEPDFSVNESKEPIECNRINNLYDEIMKSKDKIEGTINIGLIYGVAPVEREHKSRAVIERDLGKLFEKLRQNNISARRLPDMGSYSFILDSRTGEIMHDGVESKNKRITLDTAEPNRDKEVIR